MPLCYPNTTDWSCAYTPEQLEEMRNDPEKLRKMQRSEALAWYTLASLCAYQIGVCPTTIRPCAAGCLPGGSWMEATARSGGTSALPLLTIGRSFTPHVEGGQWVNSCGCSSSDSCSCTALSEVILPGPVGSIESVVIDGVELDPQAYRVDDGNRLVRQDGDVWPGCQDMSKPGAPAEGVFTVTYFRGAAPNEMTEMAAGVLATEFYKACIGDGKCRLPRGVEQVTRGGATYKIDTGLFADGVTKISEVDAVIRIYNPYRAKGPSTVLSPDSRSRGRTQTWGYR